MISFGDLVPQDYSMNFEDFELEDYEGVCPVYEKDGFEASPYDAIDKYKDAVKKEDSSGFFSWSMG